MTQVSLEAVLEGLRADGLVAARAGQAEALIARLSAVQPWYVRAMVGVGAWLASLLLIGFVAGFGLALGGSAVIGLALIAGAAWLRRRAAAGDNDFIVQCTLATSLAGQALFCWGVADLLSGNQLETGCWLLLVVSAALFFAFPDRVHRVLMVLFAVSALVALLYALDLQAVVPVIGPLLAAALVAVYERQAALAAAGHGALVRPLVNGLLISAFGCLLLSTIYVMPGFGPEFGFYPRPWISTLLLAPLFLYVGGRAWPALAEDGGRPPLPGGLLLLVIAAVSAAAWAAPGLLLALIVLVLGAAAGHRTLVAAGIVFLGVFIAAYFYGIEMTMLGKSFTLIGSGAAILGARWLLMRVAGSAAT